MWNANKKGIIALAIGFALLGAAYALLAEQDKLLAQQTLAVGICALLFVVALWTWLSARRDWARYLQEMQDNTPEDEEEDDDAPKA